MLVRLLLWVFDRLRWGFGLLGVNYTQFRAIMEAKLTLDGRRAGAGVQQGQRKAKNTFAWTLFFYTFMGLFIGVTVVAQAGSVLVSMTIVHAFVMMMIAMSLIADFSSVLLDPTDNAILQPRPISGRTLLVARIAHVTTYLALLVASLSACTLVVGTIRHGWLFPLVLVATLVCSINLVVFVVHLFYLLAMRLMNLEKFRDVILYFQIVMTVVVVAGYQVMPQLMNTTQLRQLRIDDRWWIHVFPPAWMAAPLDLVAGEVGQPQIILSILALVVPTLGLIAVVWLLAPAFEQALARLEQHGGHPGKPASHAERRQPLVYRLSHWLTRRPGERAVFEMIWKLASRDRQFKLRVYPGVAFLVLFGFVFVLTDINHLPHEPNPPPAATRLDQQSGDAPGDLDDVASPLVGDVGGNATGDAGGNATGDGGGDATGGVVARALAKLRATKKYLFLLYFACALAPTAIFAQRYSNQFEAAWVYYAMPFETPGDVLVGALKVMMARFVTVAFGLMAVLTLLIWGWSIAPDILLAASATVLISALHARIFGRIFPFSEMFGMAEGSGRAGRSLVFMLLPAAMGGLHYLLQYVHPLAVLPAVPVVLMLAAIVFRAYRRTSWPTLIHASR